MYSTDLSATVALERLEIETELAHLAVLRHAACHPDLRATWERYAQLRAKLDRERRTLRESGA